MKDISPFWSLNIPDEGYFTLLEPSSGTLKLQKGKLNFIRYAQTPEG
jgi:hypothetical protein